MKPHQTRHEHLSGSVSEILDFLYSLEPRDTLDQQKLVTRFLSHRSVDIRLAAAEALGVASTGTEALRARLQVERNPLVLADIVESLGAVRDLQSRPQIEKILRNHPSPLVRKWSAMALVDMLGADAREALLKTIGVERSRQVVAVVNGLLVHLGVESALSRYLRSLQSKDPIVLSNLASLVKDYPPTFAYSQIVFAFRKALQRSEGRGTKLNLRKALKLLQALEKQQSALAH